MAVSSSRFSVQAVGASSVTLVPANADYGKDAGVGGVVSSVVINTTGSPSAAFFAVGREVQVTINRF